MERKERIGPTPSEVLSKWELPNIADQTSTAGPVEAFRLFMAYAERALNHDFERELKSALHFDACHAGEIQPNKDGHYIASAATAERIMREVSTALRERITPLLPAIHAYVNGRPNDPATANRLAWMAAQIEAMPGVLEGRALWRSREQPEGFLMPRKFEPMAWKELHDGLLETLNTASDSTGSTSAPRPLQRIEWEGSTIEFITILKMLVKRKYVELPSTGGKQGEGNVSEFIRRFQQTFIVRKDDETEFTTEGLADRWRGRPMGEDRERQFDIPEATRKRPRA